MSPELRPFDKKTLEDVSNVGRQRTCVDLREWRPLGGKNPRPTQCPLSVKSWQKCEPPGPNVQYRVAPPPQKIVREERPVTKNYAKYQLPDVAGPHCAKKRASAGATIQVTPATTTPCDGGTGIPGSRLSIRSATRRPEPHASVQPRCPCPALIHRP